MIRYFVSDFFVIGSIYICLQMINDYKFMDVNRRNYIVRSSRQPKALSQSAISYGYCCVSQSAINFHARFSRLGLKWSLSTSGCVLLMKAMMIRHTCPCLLLMKVMMIHHTYPCRHLTCRGILYSKTFQSTRNTVGWISGSKSAKRHSCWSIFSLTSSTFERKTSG